MDDLIMMIEVGYGVVVKLTNKGKFVIQKLEKITNIRLN